MPKTCAVCKATEGSPLNHDWDEWTVILLATEAAEGEEKRIYKRDASHWETRPIPKLTHTHNFNQEKAEEAYLQKAATCTASAVYYKSCRCGEKGEETFTVGEPLGHTGGTATCVKGPVCTRCGQEYGSAQGHAWEKATCTEPKTCAVCKATEGNALGHDHSVSLDTGAPADCTTDGREPDMKCSRCADVQSGAVIHASGHSAGAAVKEDIIAATCTVDGSYAEVVYCGKCNAEISRTPKTTPALGHAWGEWSVITPATEEAEGVKQRTCQNDPQHTDQ